MGGAVYEKKENWNDRRAGTEAVAADAPAPKKIVIFISFSNSLIAFVRLGCEINNFFAASLIDFAFATSITYFNCCNVIFTSIIL